MDRIVDFGPPGPPSSVYVHIPFCRDRCTYCAFATLADDPARHRELVEALELEAARASHASLGIAPLQTLYLGGGTPALLAPALLARLLGSLKDRFGLSPGAEITLEANPTDVDAAALASWHEVGITRLSVGIQTFRDDVLAGFGRHHDGGVARAALQRVAQRWGGDWSADLLVGWLGQQPEDVRDDIEALLGFDPPHVAVYGLTIEPHTVLARLRAAGHAVAAPEASHPDLDRAWSEPLERAGYQRYEVSNHCRDGRRSRHNQVYWANASYVGLGPGASSSVHPHRWSNHRDLDRYLVAVSGVGPRVSCEIVSPEARLLESLAVGLRTADGLPTVELDRRFTPAWRDALGGSLAELFAAGALLEAGGFLRLPASGMPTVDRLMASVAAACGRLGGDGRDATVGVI